jgi:hypothetical protein
MIQSRFITCFSFTRQSETKPEMLRPDVSNEVGVDPELIGPSISDNWAFEISVKLIFSIPVSGSVRSVCTGLSALIDEAASMGAQTVSGSAMYSRIGRIDEFRGRIKLDVCVRNGRGSSGIAVWHLEGLRSWQVSGFSLPIDDGGVLNSRCAENRMCGRRDGPTLLHTYRRR